MRKNQIPNRLIRFLLPRMEYLLFFVLFLSVLGIGQRMLNVDGDLGRHLTLGNYILAQHQIPMKDLFSHTMGGLPLTPHEWLADVLFAVFNHWAGLTGVVLLCAFVIAISFTLLYRQSSARSGSLLWPLFFTLLAVAAASLHWLARPHLFTMLFVVLWMGVLRSMEVSDGRGWQILPLIMLFWVNIHGAFIAGFVIAGLVFAGDYIDYAFGGRRNIRAFLIQKRGLVLGSIAAFFVSFINPAGWKLWGTSIGFLKNTYLVNHTAEYFSPNFHDASTFPFLLFILVSMLCLYLTHNRMKTANLLLLLGWTAMALISVRNVPLYAIVVTPILVESWKRIVTQYPAFRKVVRFDDGLYKIDNQVRGWVFPAIGVIIIGMGLIAGARNSGGNQHYAFDSAMFPVDAVDWLDDNPIQGKMFNYFPWGGYLLYRMWPSELVFIDGQTDFYGERLTRAYETVIMSGKGWEQVLQRYDVQWIIIPPTSFLARELEYSSGWQQVYGDSTSVIFVRR